MSSRLHLNSLTSGSANTQFWAIRTTRQPCMSTFLFALSSRIMYMYRYTSTQLEVQTHFQPYQKPNLKISPEPPPETYAFDVRSVSLPSLPPSLPTRPLPPTPPSLPPSFPPLSPFLSIFLYDKLTPCYMVL